MTLRMNGQEIYNKSLDGHYITPPRHDFKTAEAQRELNEQFKQDLLSAYFFREHPSAEECFHMAWDYGNGDRGDYPAVVRVFDRIYSLFLIKL